jgi:sulfate permease
MSLVEIGLLAASVFFALNIGGATMAPAFSAALGARLIARPWAVLLFGVFVTAGALLLGRFVARTLGSSLVPRATLDTITVLCVISGAAAALFMANVLKIPQSTTWVTVFGIGVVGLTRGNLNADTFLYRLLPAWIGLPVASFVLTVILVRLFYPLRGWNYRVYEHLQKHEWKLRAFTLISSCYVAVAVGANNTSLIVGPIAAAGTLERDAAFLAIAPLFALGAGLIPWPARTIGKDIVPLGVFTASLSNLVVGTCLITASRLGIPQSLVQLSTASVLGVSFVKEGDVRFMHGGLIKKIGILWLVTPLLASALTWILLAVLA